MAEGFTGGHHEVYRAWRVDSQGARIGQPLPLVGGALEWNRFLDVTGSGDIEIRVPEDTDWANFRIQVEYEARHRGEQIRYDLFTGIAKAPEGMGHGVTSVYAQDLSSELVEDAIPEAFGVDSGESPLGPVRDLIESVGLMHSIPDSPDPLRVAMSWEAGTPKLRIVNDLLAAVGYTPIRASGSGILVSGPQTPALGAPVHDFTSGPESVASIEEPEEERDLYSIPNRVIGKSTTDGDTEPLVAVAENNDPESPWSIPNRGVRTRVEEDIEASSQESLQDKVDLLLATSSQVTWRQTIRHLRVNLQLGQTVRAPNGKLFDVAEMSQELFPGSLSETTVRRIDSLYTPGTEEPETP